MCAHRSQLRWWNSSYAKEHVWSRTIRKECTKRAVEKRFADSIISELFANADLIPSDRAFALELFYGVLRNLTLLDFWIGCLRASHIETNVRDILRLGLYQIFLLKTPGHAAVHETVVIASQKQRSIINAILRAATKQQSELLAQADAQLVFVRT